MTRSPEHRLVWVLAAAAATGPSLLAFNLPPSPTFLNQAVAIALWGWFATTLGRHPAGGSPTQWAQDTAAPLAGLVLLALAALGSWLIGALPRALSLSAAGALLAAMLLLLAGAAARRHPRAGEWLAAFCAAWVLAGLLNALVACIQVFAPAWADGDWIARSGIPGRAVGNLRQSNHLSTLLIWATVALVPLVDSRRLRLPAGLGLAALFMLAVVASASRTGMLSVVLLAAWGLWDKRLARPARTLLVATPVLFGLAWAAMALWASVGGHVFGAEARLGESDLSASRFGIWANTWALIRAHPLWGVGFGEFNFAWTLSVFPGRPVAFFDHAHNLPLHLAAEVGLPLATVVCGSFLWGLWLAWRRGRQAAPEALYPGLAAAGAMVVLIGLHSQLEYPLWYAYFLLPTAWAWGFLLGRPEVAAEAPPTQRTTRPPALLWGGVMLVLGAGLAFVDYVRVAHIFVASEPVRPLEERIANGQRSLLFSHHADYAAATLEPPLNQAGAAFAGATHYLLDTRLMVAWARHLQAQGRTQEAAHLAERLREFRNPGAREFLAPCQAASDAMPAFPCQAPSAPVPWQAYRSEP